MFFKWIDDLLCGYEVGDIDDSLVNRIIDLESKVLNLQQENVELTNCLYEVENRLQAQI